MNKIISRPYDEQGESSHERIFGKREIPHGNSDLPVFKCNNCNQVFNSKKEFDEHIHQPIY